MDFGSLRWHIIVIVDMRELRDGPVNNGVSRGYVHIDTALSWLQGGIYVGFGSLGPLVLEKCLLGASHPQRQMPSGNSASVLGILGQSVFEAQSELHNTKTIQFLPTCVPLCAPHPFTCNIIK